MMPAESFELSPFTSSVHTNPRKPEISASTVSAKMTRGFWGLPESDESMIVVGLRNPGMVADSFSASLSI